MKRFIKVPFVMRANSLLGPNSFTLVEVVMALAVISFSLVLVVGLMGISLRNNRESSDRIEAANIASLLVSCRRALPAATANMSGFALPPISSTSSFPITGTAKLAPDGTTNSSLSVCNMYYNITTNSVPNTANLDLILWWPLNSANIPTNNPGNYYEVVTQIGLSSQIVAQ